MTNLTEDELPVLMTWENATREELLAFAKHYKQAHSDALKIRNQALDKADEWQRLCKEARQEAEDYRDRYIRFMGTLPSSFRLSWEQQTESDDVE